jgi:hypothetical protein
MTPERFRIFLLSPAQCSGKRARLLQSPTAESNLARRLRGSEGAALGEVFTFVSSLYFRGKLAYACAFARPPRGRPGVYVITPGDGLSTPESPVRLEDLRRYARVPVDPDEARFRRPLFRDLQALAPHWTDAEVVLLGSIASDKYTNLLTSVLGARLLFPADFVGRGDMSRGGLLLRCARQGRELRYITLLGAERRGQRPARLPPPEA